MSVRTTIEAGSKISQTKLPKGCDRDLSNRLSEESKLELDKILDFDE